MYLLGFDIGSSSVKVALVEAATRTVVTVVHAPDTEMPIEAPQPGWAEQAPQMWWKYACQACQSLSVLYPDKVRQISAIGIAYQMHGLVLTDAAHTPLRPAIIWCDSRAVEVGNQALRDLGPGIAPTLLNPPGNFTASKLRWVQTHEPHHLAAAAWYMLPGDYIALRMTGVPATTVSGLSEGVIWDFGAHRVSETLAGYYQIDTQLIPQVVPTCGHQGELLPAAAAELGLRPGIPVTYRAGDQPNNALALNVLQPGEIAATGGTSGVVYGVVDRLLYDPQGRVNSFAHVNHEPHQPRIGVLLCINGAGSQYNWIRQQVALAGMRYSEMEQSAASAPIGADGLMVLPFGNGAERMLGNRTPGGHISPIQFNRHQRAHIFRATLEGIAFSFVYGIQLMADLGLDLRMMRVGHDNLFQSSVFSQTISNVTECEIQVIETTGAAGAACAAGVAVGLYSSLEEAVGGVAPVKRFLPDRDRIAHEDAYHRWAEFLSRILA
ncbi:MAG: FGGY family carbohydrate kinase [Bacteroidia bacterium]|nr:FGGY family carbohydrate kinase [Bacteroidia bacterium]